MESGASGLICHSWPFFSTGETGIPNPHSWREQFGLHLWARVPKLGDLGNAQIPAKMVGHEWGIRDLILTLRVDWDSPCTCFSKCGSEASTSWLSICSFCHRDQRGFSDKNYTLPVMTHIKIFCEAYTNTIRSVWRYYIWEQCMIEVTSSVATVCSINSKWPPPVSILHMVVE